MEADDKRSDFGSIITEIPHGQLMVIICEFPWVFGTMKSPWKSHGLNWFHEFSMSNPCKSVYGNSIDFPWNFSWPANHGLTMTNSWKFHCAKNTEISWNATKRISLVSHITYMTFPWLNKNSSGDEIANVNFLTTISHTRRPTSKYRKRDKPTSFNKLDDR